MRREMRRIVIIAVTLLLAVLPVLHSHCAATSCAICAMSTGCPVVAAPTVTAPLAVAYALTSTVVTTIAAAAPRLSSSRAPPVA